MRFVEIVAATAIVGCLWLLTGELVWQVTDNALIRAALFWFFGILALTMRFLSTYFGRTLLEERFEVILLHTLTVYSILISIFGLLIFQEEYEAVSGPQGAAAIGAVVSIIFLYILVRERLSQSKEVPCFYCGQLVRRAYLVCPFCVFPIQLICPACHTQIDDEFDFCPRCGAETPWKHLPSGQRVKMNRGVRKMLSSLEEIQTVAE